MKLQYLSLLPLMVATLVNGEHIRALKEEKEEGVVEKEPLAVAEIENGTFVERAAFYCGNPTMTHF